MVVCLELSCPPPPVSLCTEPLYTRDRSSAIQHYHVNTRAHQRGPGYTLPHTRLNKHSAAHGAALQQWEWAPPDQA